MDESKMSSEEAPLGAFPAPRSERELRRLRGYEGLMVFAVVAAGVVIAGYGLFGAVSSSLEAVARSLGAVP